MLRWQNDIRPHLLIYEIPFPAAIKFSATETIPGFSLRPDTFQDDVELAAIPPSCRSKRLAL